MAKQIWKDSPKLRELYEQSDIKQQYPNFTFEEYLNLLNNNTSWVGVNTKNLNKELDKLKQKKNTELLEENIQNVTDPVKIKEQYEEVQNVVDPLVQADKSQADREREGFREEAKKEVTTELPGLTDQQRRSMQQSANAAINKQVQNYRRTIASGQGRRGVRGGAAMAPQIELARQAMDVQNQFQRDLVEQDTDLAMRRLAAYLANVEGRSAEQLLRRGQYFDYITGRQQQGLQGAYKKYYDNLFQGMKK